MGTRTSWIPSSLSRLFGQRASPHGVDFDGDGALAPEERITNADGSFTLGSPGDWRAFVQHHRTRLVRRPGPFRWGAGLSLDNPIHDRLAVEAEVVSQEDIRNAYTFVQRVLEKVRIRSSLLIEPEEKFELANRVLAEEGIRFEEHQEELIALDIRDRRFDCSSNSMLILAIGHELGWPLTYMTAPGHDYVRWEEPDRYVNFSAGSIMSDADILDLLQILPALHPKHTVLRPLDREALLSDAYAARALFHRHAGRSNAAWQDNTMALSLDPLNARAQGNRAVHHAKDRKLKAARDDFIQLKLLHPSFVRVRSSLARILFLLGQREEALALLQEECALFPGNFEALAHTAIAHSAMGQLQEAVAVAREVRAIDPDGEFSAFLLARLLLRQKRVDEAIAISRKGLEQHPRSGQLLLIRARAHRLKGALPKAVADLQTLLALEPKNRDAQELLESIETELLFPPPR